MKPKRHQRSRRSAAQVPVQWQDSAWFPPVLAAARFPAARRQPVFWPQQIITDPAVCQGRTINL